MFWIGLITGLVAGIVITIVGLALESIRRRDKEELSEYNFDPRKPWKRRR